MLIFAKSREKPVSSCEFILQAYLFIFVSQDFSGTEQEDQVG